MLKFLLLLILSASSAAQAADTQSAAMTAAAALYDGITIETLPNGLTVYLKPIPSSPVVSTMMSYKVGSSDEDPKHSGLAHYLEHLMFKGTAKLMPGDIDRMTQSSGGSNNAYTSEDSTVYHFDFSSETWETALAIEADRMRGVLIDAKHEFEQEKGAVVSELERDEDMPGDLEHTLILPKLFGTGTPYGHPVIGERAHVRGATAKTIKAYYDQWYHPNNASLVVAGGFDPAQAMVKIKEMFGKIPAGKLPKRRNVPPPPRRKAPVTLTMKSKFETPRLVVGFNTVSASDPDAVVLDVIAAMLSTGKTSRLYRALIESAQVANDAGVNHNPGKYPGWMQVVVELLPGQDLTHVEELTIKEITKLRDEPVSAAELARTKETMLTQDIFGREGAHALADSIAYGVSIQSMETLKAYLPSLMAITAADVQRVAKKYLDPKQRVVVHSKPAHASGSKEAPPTKKGRIAQKPAPAPLGGALAQTKRVVLPNGLTVLLFEEHRLPLFVAHSYVKNTRLFEAPEKAGAAALTGSLLDEGTTHLDGKQIAEKIADAGGTLTFTTAESTVAVLSPHRQVALELLLDCLGHPSFPDASLARERTRQLTDLEQDEHEPANKAQLTYRAKVYGSHPYGRHGGGSKATVEALQKADLTSFHERAYAPSNMILALVGDFVADEVAADVEKLTADWPKTPFGKPDVQAPPAVKATEETFVSMPDAAQLYLFVGHLGIRRNDPDYFKLQVMDNVFGTGAGFTDRLSARLRDREGLGYSVSGQITASAAEEPGLFTCAIGTDPGHMERAKVLFLEEIRRIRDTEPTAAEVAGAKAYLLGQIAFKLVTNDDVAEQLLLSERYGLGLDALEKYRSSIAAVTPKDVQDAARAHLDPDHVQIVAAGAIDASGKPLKGSK